MHKHPCGRFLCILLLYYFNQGVLYVSSINDHCFNANVMCNSVQSISWMQNKPLVAGLGLLYEPRVEDMC